MRTSLPGAEEIWEENPPAAVNPEIQQVAKRRTRKRRDQGFLVFVEWCELHDQRRRKSEMRPVSGDEEFRRMTCC